MVLTSEQFVADLRARVEHRSASDDEKMATAIAVGLRRALMAVDVAFDGTGGLTRAIDNDYDVIVLDRDLPGLHGDDICAQLVSAGCRSRVLMLSALS